MKYNQLDTYNQEGHPLTDAEVRNLLHVTLNFHFAKINGHEADYPVTLLQKLKVSEHYVNIYELISPRLSSQNLPSKHQNFHMDLPGMSAIHLARYQAYKLKAENR